MSRSRCWCFTINERADEDGPVRPTFAAPMTYMKYQLERGEQGTLHYQGCLFLSRIASLAVVKRLLGVNHAHLEIARSPKHAIAYCGKDETRIDGPWEHGEEPKGQGHRSDLQILLEGIDDKTTIASLASSHPGAVVKFGKGLDMLLKLRNPARRRDNLKVYCLWGASGIGKSHAAWDLFPELYVVMDKKTPWMDGYANHRVALFDDYGPGMMNIHQLKNCLDKYKVMMPTKGGSVPWNPDVIILTSNIDPREWYPTAGPNDITALMRRMHVKFVEQREEVDEWRELVKKECDDPTIARGVPAAAAAAAAEVVSDAEGFDVHEVEDVSERSEQEATLPDEQEVEESEEDELVSPVPLKRRRVGPVFGERMQMLAQIQADVRARL